mmetsp:Transcript_37864/g.82447  ORF Transcript_37864/g.82447 Transcript_37864/m.82447 type:complete len:578 (+) Transcript_37864:296-2029(+)
MHRLHDHTSWTHHVHRHLLHVRRHHVPWRHHVGPRRQEVARCCAARHRTPRHHLMLDDHRRLARRTLHHDRPGAHGVGEVLHARGQVVHHVPRRRPSLYLRLHRRPLRGLPLRRRPLPLLRRARRRALLRRHRHGLALRRHRRHARPGQHLPRVHLHHLPRRYHGHPVGRRAHDHHRRRHIGGAVLHHHGRWHIRWRLDHHHLREGLDRAVHLLAWRRPADLHDRRRRVRGPLLHHHHWRRRVGGPLTQDHAGRHHGVLPRWVEVRREDPGGHLARRHRHRRGVVRGRHVGEVHGHDLVAPEHPRARRPAHHRPHRGCLPRKVRGDLGRRSRRHGRVAHDALRRLRSGVRPGGSWGRLVRRRRRRRGRLRGLRHALPPLRHGVLRQRHHAARRHAVGHREAQLLTIRRRVLQLCAWRGSLGHDEGDRHGLLLHGRHRLPACGEVATSAVADAVLMQDLRRGVLRGPSHDQVVTAIPVEVKPYGVAGAQDPCRLRGRLLRLRNRLLRLVAHHGRRRCWCWCVLRCVRVDDWRPLVRHHRLRVGDSLALHDLGRGHPVVRVGVRHGGMLHPGEATRGGL